LLRISVLPAGTEENRRRRADRFLHGVPPERVAEALRRCDLALFPAAPGEGFGLPLLEALASGVPAVASRLPSTRFMTAGAIPLVPPGDAAAFAAVADRLLAAGADWRRVRRDGLRAARRFAPGRVADELEEAVVWAAAGAEPGRAGGPAEGGE
jgi:alpha-1,3-rhamnosyl/mannosyltransferase